MKRSKRSGTTLVETTVAAGLSTIAILGATLLFTSGSMIWMRGYGKIDAEATTYRAVREVSRELREAMKVTVDSNGLGLTYQLPLKDDSGTFVMPATWDNVTRRIELEGTNLVVTGGVTPHTICKGVILTDPQSPNGTGTYRIFTAGAGSTTRSLTVMLVSSRSADYNKTATARSRETIYLRNILQLVK
ncbi:MAG TPA: hypothetical protein VHE55_14695 [Fimbriimonadaceae bacterium]|nr:hypothetical protein [Fimbriimonadaceae bacterium]